MKPEEQKVIIIALKEWIQDADQKSKEMFSDINIPMKYWEEYREQVGIAKNILKRMKGK